MLEHQSVHVDDVKGAIRAGLDHHRTKPVVGGCQKFFLGLFGSAMAGEANALGREHFTVDQVMNRLTNKNAVGKFRTKQFIAIGRCATGGGDMAGHAYVIKSLEYARCRINAGSLRVIGEHSFGRANPQVRIAGDVFFRNKIVP